MVILELLKAGIPYETIQDMEADSIATILALQAVFNEKQQEAMNKNG